MNQSGQKTLHLTPYMKLLTTCGDLMSIGARANKKWSNRLYGMISPSAGLSLTCSTLWNNSGLKQDKVT